MDALLFFAGMAIVVWRLAAWIEVQRRREIARERVASDNVREWFSRHPPTRMDTMRGHPPRPPRGRGRSASRGDYFPFDDDFPSNLS